MELVFFLRFLGCVCWRSGEGDRWGKTWRKVGRFRNVALWLGCGSWDMHLDLQLLRAF